MKMLINFKDAVRLMSRRSAKDFRPAIEKFQRLLADRIRLRYCRRYSQSLAQLNIIIATGACILIATVS